jgi:dihydroflavonol-4-reductase
VVTWGDIDALLHGMSGCDWVFQVAALYSFWSYTWQDFYQSNVQGTRNVMEAARQVGLHWLVHTRPIAALVLDKDRSPVSETTTVSLKDMIGSYKRSKYLAEQVAIQFAQQGLPVVIVNPSAPFGIYDYKPIHADQVILEIFKRRMFDYVDTGLNIVEVDDVANGHLLAAESGRVGERYILDGGNMTLK